MKELVGQNIGRYHILEQLGQGGMAVVFRAFDTRLERDVAIKVIRTDLFGTAVLGDLLKRFEREAKSLARLDHLHIVNIHDFGEHDGAPFLVMEYLPGGTLKDLIKSMDSPMPYQEAAAVLYPIAQALAYAHEKQIIHRDIKPENILITNSGDPKLSDFGVSKILSTEEGTQLTSTGLGVGTPEFMAPEQWTGDVVFQTDIYSLGVVFYELITGEKPYTADTPAAILVKLMSDPLTNPRDFIPDLPDSVERMIYKSMAKFPEDRYKTMQIFANVLQEISQLDHESSPGKADTSHRHNVEGHDSTPVAKGTRLVSLQEREAEGGKKSRKGLWIGLVIAGLILSILFGLYFLTDWFIFDPLYTEEYPEEEQAAISEETQDLIAEIQATEPKGPLPTPPGNIKAPPTHLPGSVPPLVREESTICMIIDEPGNIRDGHIDVLAARVNFENDLIEIVFHLRNLPEEFLINRPVTQMGFQEVGWEIYFDLDNDPETHISTDDWLPEGVDYVLSVAHTKSGSEIRGKMEELFRLVHLVYDTETGELYEEKPSAQSHLKFDVNGNHLAFGDVIPGFTKDSKVYVTTYDDADPIGGEIFICK